MIKKLARYCVIWISLFALCGCADNHNLVSEKPAPAKENMVKESEDEDSDTTEMLTEIPYEDKIGELQREEPQIVEADWSGYFDGLCGAVVLYEASEEKYRIYNGSLAEERHSPCSTFKIISSLVGLETGVIDSENSVRTWSGEVFWNEEWNRDIDFEEAFRTSCVWYYREVIDEIGKEAMQVELDRLEYGNCDISDWTGELNHNNSNRALTGFWLESSLKISPKEQTEVMERIFGKDSVYSEEVVNHLKKVMLVSKQKETDISIYGKTGMGKLHGITVDAWYTGFAETEEKRIYFCVYLGESEEKDVSSTVAKEIAVQVLEDYFDE